MSLTAPANVSVSNVGRFTAGSLQVASSTQLQIAWTAAAGSVDHYRVAASETIGGTQASARTASGVTSATLTDLKSGTAYTLVVTACGDAGCTQSAAAAAVSGTTPAEHWLLQGSGRTTAGLTRIVQDGNARISATRFGPEAGASANRVQLYYGPSGVTSQVLATALSPAVRESDPSSYLSFTRAPGTGLASAPGATLVTTVATGQGVPLSAALGSKVRLFFEGQGADGRNRIFTIDSVDGYVGQDFNAGSPTVCSTAQEYAAGGGCAVRVAIGVEGDTVAPARGLQNVRQHKVGVPTLTDWRWDGAAGTFMVFTVDRVTGCSTSPMNHGYAVWDGSAWNVQYDAAGCPRLFTSAQAAFPMHLGGARFKLYYGDPSVTTGRLSSNLPFLGPKKLIYADGNRTGAADRVDFDDWESQAQAREVVFLWPDGQRLDATAQGYIDDYHFLAPTGSLGLQVMYLAITNGTEIPFGAAAVLLNP